MNYFHFGPFTIDKTNTLQSIKLDAMRIGYVTLLDTTYDACLLQRLGFT